VRSRRARTSPSSPTGRSARRTFIAFADGVTERIAQREEITARELGQHEPNVNRILEDTREAMAMRMQTLYADEVKSAVIQPDARTMAFVRQGQTGRHSGR
jgi:hypothetical protein